MESNNNENDEQLRIEFEKFEQIIYSASDTYIRHFESDLKYIGEKSSLILWLIGLSVGMEIFVLDQMDKESFNSIPIMIFSILSGGFFIINCFYGLLLRIKQMRLISHHLQIITFYDHQKLYFEINFHRTSAFAQRVTKDFSEGTAIKKICELEYIDKSLEKNDPVALYDNQFIQKSDNHPFTLLVLQAITTIILLLLIVFK